MADDSEISAESGKQSTKRTGKLTRAQALEIVQQSLLEYQKAGGRVEIMPAFYYQGERYVAIMMPDIMFAGDEFLVHDGRVTGDKK